MKRLSGVWENIVDEERAYSALLKGTKHKRTKRQVRNLLIEDRKARFQIDPEKGMEYVRGLIQELESGEWKHSPPRHERRYCKNRASSKGKWRDLYIPTLDDHIIHHMVMQESMEAFTKGMHPHCCGSVPGRGIKHVLQTVGHWMRDDLACRYFVKLDIKKFFDNIDRSILKEKIARKIKDRLCLWAHYQIIGSAPTACPVGYYPSPWYANLYLEDLDWFVEQELYKERRGKRIKYVRHYLRYVDDILLIGTSKADLLKAIKAIKEEVAKIGLSIKNTWEIKKIGKHVMVDGKWKMKKDTYWCDIGGYKFCKDATILRDGVYLSAKRLAHEIGRKPRPTIHDCQAINAKIAWAEKCDSKTFFENDIKPYVNIKETRRCLSMWARSENGENVKPADVERSGSRVIVRKDFEHVEEGGDKPEHYEWMEWQMTMEQYEVYQSLTEEAKEQAEKVADLEGRNTMLEECLLEMSEMVYA